MLLNPLTFDGAAESLLLRTVQQDTETFTGKSVSFNVASAANPNKKLIITGAFTSANQYHTEQTYPNRILQRFKHLKSLPIQTFSKVQPTLLIGSDHPHLLCPMGYVILGLGCGPAAVHTQLSWTLQGPTLIPEEQDSSNRTQKEVQAYFLRESCNELQLHQDVEQLWQVDVLPFQSLGVITHSKRDQEAVACIDQNTVRNC